MDEPTVTATLTLSQARVVMRALNLYSRLHMGQVDELMFLFGYRRTFDREQVRSIIRELRARLFPELSANEYYSVSDEHVGDGRDAWDVQQAMRYAVAWHLHPEGGCTVDFNTPMRSSSAPLPVVTVTGKKGKE